MTQLSATAVLVAALCAAGCATQEGFHKVMDAYVGQAEGGLVSGMGTPQSVSKGPDGSKILTFVRIDDSDIGGTTTYQPVTTTSNARIGVASFRPTATTTMHPVQHPASNAAPACTIRFRLVDDRVQSWQADGFHCVN